MCRHLAHLGPPVNLAALVLDAPRGLCQQAYAPADMRGGGTVNVDGFGAGWYPHPGSEPVRYRSVSPIWADASFAEVARATCAGAVLAAVRSATPGMPVAASAVAPFSDGRWLFSHNGVVVGWPHTLARIARRLPVTDLLTLDAPTDAATLWALVRARLRDGEDPADVLAGTVREVAAAAPGSRLNLLVTDGATIWATAWGHALSVRVGADVATVASEPFDLPGPGGDGGGAVRRGEAAAAERRRGDPAQPPGEPVPAWDPVPQRHLVVARPGHLQQCPLGPEPR